MPSETEKRWLAAWRLAGPELERIRREELRNLPETPVVESPEDASDSAAREKASSGLVIWQQWMMRLRILELQKQLRSQILSKIEPLAELREDPEILRNL